MVALKLLRKALDVTLLIIGIDDEMIARSFVPVRPRWMRREKGKDSNNHAVDCLKHLRTLLVEFCCEPAS